VFRVVCASCTAAAAAAAAAAAVGNPQLLCGNEILVSLFHAFVCAMGSLVLVAFLMFRSIACVCVCVCRDGRMVLFVSVVSFFGYGGG